MPFFLPACEKNVTFHGKHVEWYEFKEGGTAKERTLRKGKWFHLPLRQLRMLRMYEL